MKKLIFGLFVLLVTSMNVNSKALAKPESTVMVCGDVNGVFGCTTYNYDDGWDCLIISNQGAPGGLYFGAGCDI